MSSDKFLRKFAPNNKHNSQNQTQSQMKKLLLSLLGVLLTGLSANAENQAITGWGTTAQTSYKTYTSDDNWTAKNSALINVNGTICPTLNGKTSAIGTLTSPTLEGGIGSLSLQAYNNYSEKNGISLKAEIQQDGKTIASHDFTDKSLAQSTESSFEPWNNINISGDFTIVITNNCPTNKTSNADRASITTLTWTNYEINPNAPQDVELSYELNGAIANVTLSCATEGATIYYGFSNNEITNEYTATFPVTENCTVYAFAQKGDEKGNTTSMDIVVPYTSFRDVVTKAQNEEELTIIGDFSVLYANQYSSSIYNVILTDGTSNLFIYNVSENIEVGTKVTKVQGTATDYHGLFEIENATLTTEEGDGVSYTAKPVNTLANLTKENNLLDQIIIDGCTVSGSSSSLTVSFGSETLPLNNRYGLQITNGVSYKMYAFVWFDNALKLVPYQLEAGTVKETVKTPIITPNKRELNVDETVTITCATEDTKIYYTLDGSTPTQESTLYTAPFTIEADVTVTARAFYEGDGDDMLPSEIVTKEYHFFDPYCNVIDNSHDGDGGIQYVTHNCIVDNVEYTMRGIHDKDKGLQLNKKQGCFIVQSGDNADLAIASIAVDFNQNSQKIEFTVRASNTPYTENTYETGVIIGTISFSNTSVEFDKDYDYFSFYPSNKEGAVYLNSVTINYRDPKPADESTVPAFDNFVIISDEGTILASGIEASEDWITKYTVNGSEEAEYDAEEGIYLEDVDPATLHTISIWHEHYYHGTTTVPTEFNHLTKPSITVGDESMNFGIIGEGVKVYFTINGTEPVIETTSAANAPRRAKASEDGTAYAIDSADDATATHVISKSNTTVTVHNSVTNAVQIKAVAVHEATGTISDAAEATGATTTIEAIEANGVAKSAYDLMGRKVANPVNGLYIINGKKVRI